LLLAFESFAKICTFSGKLLKLEKVGRLFFGLNKLIRFKIITHGIIYYTLKIHKELVLNYASRRLTNQPTR